MNFSIRNYIYLLKYIKSKYKFIPSYHWNKYKNKRNYIILRHDIDFDTSLALEMAKLEKKNKIFSNYFFLMRDDFYDLYSLKTINDIRSILDLGHNIGLHINPRSYNSFANSKKRLMADIKYFKSFYNIKINSISYHQPSVQDFENINLKINFNSYNPKIMKYYKYFSDSSMKFDIVEFKKHILTNNNIQLLIHPLWWTSRGITRNEKLKYILKIKKNSLKDIFNFYNNILNKKFSIF